MPRPARQATCHPDRRHCAHGLCYACYRRTPKQRARSNAYTAEYLTRPETKKKTRAYRKKYTNGKRHDPVIYLIKCATTGLVKVGLTTSIRQRLMTLQIGSPTPLALVATIPGSAGAEAKLHKRYARARDHGEWFVARKISSDLKKVFKKGVQ